MTELLQAINRRLEPLVDKMNGRIGHYSVGELGSFYDADWGGIPTQAVLDKICKKVHGDVPKSHFITYAHTSSAVEFSLRHHFNGVAFLDYEPHEELGPISNGAKSVDVFGHHKGRDDVTDRAQADRRISYFNPRHFLEGTEILREYRRGVPILYPFLQVAERHDVDVKLLGMLGLRGYGYKRLYEEFAHDHGIYGQERRALDGRLDKVIENVNLLVGHRLANSDRVVKSLKKADSAWHDSMTDLIALSADSKLGDRKNIVVGSAIDRSEVVGDVQIFPIETDFETIKPMVSDLDRLASVRGRKTTICVQSLRNSSGGLSSYQKVSIRTRSGVDISKLLELAHQGLPYRNYGGHESSGGFIASHYSTPEILRKILEIYFSRTGQSSVDPARDLSFLQS